MRPALKAGQQAERALLGTSGTMARHVAQPDVTIDESADVSALVEAMVRVTQANNMPPWGLIDCFRFMNSGHWRAYAEEAGMIAKIPKDYDPRHDLAELSPGFVLKVVLAYMRKFEYYGDNETRKRYFGEQ